MNYNRFDNLFPKYPKTFQIQTITGCNASCIMCPTGTSPQRIKRDYLPMQLWEKIIGECSQWEHSLDTVVMSLFNEPLLDRRLFDMVDMAKEQLATTEFIIVTNGSLLTERTIERILQSKTDAIRVSVNAYYKESFDLLRSSLDFDRIVEGTKRLIEKSKTLGKPDVVVSMAELQFNTEEVQQFVDLWSQLGAKVHVSPAWNRAGNLPVVNDFQLELVEGTGNVCSKPFVTMCVTNDGSVVLCCADYACEVVLGNIQSEKLLEIWMGPIHQATLLKMFKRENPICNRCDKPATFRTHESRTSIPIPHISDANLD